MTERPIIFSAPMVRALLDGRKTMTRRILKPQPAKWEARVIDITPPFLNEEEGGWGQVETIWSGPLVPGMCEPEREVWRPLKLPCVVGDRLWVREAFSYDRLDVDKDGTLPPWYWADGNPSGGDWTKPKPSIHMPRWASRITLEVTEVRVQRLQEISHTDAKAEGVAQWVSDYFEPQTPPSDLLVDFHCGTTINAFRRLWETLHGPDAWVVNPWVAAISFKRIT